MVHLYRNSGGGAISTVLIRSTVECTLNDASLLIAPGWASTIGVEEQSSANVKVFKIFHSGFCSMFVMLLINVTNRRKLRMKSRLRKTSLLLTEMSARDNESA